MSTTQILKEEIIADVEASSSQRELQFQNGNNVADALDNALQKCVSENYTDRVQGAIELKKIRAFIMDKETSEPDFLKIQYPAEDILIEKLDC